MATKRANFSKKTKYILVGVIMVLFFLITRNCKPTPATPLTKEEAMEYIKDDEYLEITPLSLRMRKI